ncbi:MAG: hypothetical protein ACHRXM_22445 [Isosphaerales bacterium]
MDMDFPPEHYFQTATQRMRQAQHLYQEGSSFALAIYVAGVADECLLRQKIKGDYLKEQARQFLSSAQKFIDKGVMQWQF